MERSINLEFDFDAFKVSNLMCASNYTVTCDQALMRCGRNKVVQRDESASVPPMMRACSQGNFIAKKVR